MRFARPPFIERRMHMNGTRVSRIPSIALSVSLLLLLAGCRVERPKEIISPAQLEDVLYDYHLAQIMGADLTGENAYKRSLYMEYVYSKHHITREQLDSSLVWYARYPKNLSSIYEHLEHRADVEMERIKRMQEETEHRGPKAVEGDSADLWYDNRTVVLMPLPLTNRVSYTIPVDTNFHLCDIFEWTFNVRYFPRKTSWHEVMAQLSDAVVDTLSTETAVADSLLVDSLRQVSLCNDSLAAAVLDSSSLARDTSLGDSLPTFLPVAQGMPQQPKVIASLLLHYNNDSTVAVDRVLDKENRVCITLQNTDSVRLSHVYMSLYFKSPEKTDYAVLYDNALIRYRYKKPSVVLSQDSLLTEATAHASLDSLSVDTLQSNLHADVDSARPRH